MPPVKLQLTEKDFSAYAPEKATSNAFTRPRIEVKQRALAWAKGATARLLELGLEVHASDEHPSLRNKKRVDCQWVWLSRDTAQRDHLDRLLDRGRSIANVLDDPSPYMRHAFLALRLDAEAVEVCFAVHPEARVDIDNLRARLHASAETSLASELREALAALPDEFSVGVHTEGIEAHVPASSATLATLATALERAAAGQVPLWIGWRVPRAIALEHAAILEEQLEDALVALGPIYKLVAWSRDNDNIALDQQIAGVEAERARAHEEAEAKTATWRTERERKLEEVRARAEPPPVATQRPQPKRTQKSERPPPRPVDAPKPDEVIEAKPPSAPRERREPREPRPQAPLSLDKGARVRVRSGPFADKEGTIGELDGKGGARVLLGLLSTRLELTELEVLGEAKDRPQLTTSQAASPPMQSSHRKPAPAGRRAR
jgi:sRNA-binding protein